MPLLSTCWLLHGTLWLQLDDDDEHKPGPCPLSSFRCSFFVSRRRYDEKLETFHFSAALD